MLAYLKMSYDQWITYRKTISSICKCFEQTAFEFREIMLGRMDMSPASDLEVLTKSKQEEIVK